MGMLPSPLIACLLLLAGWGAIALLGLVRPTNVTFVGRFLFPIGALIGLGLALVVAGSLGEGPETVTLVIGLPGLPVHLRLDALSRVFLLLLGSASAGISFFASGYFRKGQGTAPGVLGLQYHMFLASMGFVLLADDAYAFMVAWETMALSSYFLVTAQHGIPEIRSAGFLYLLMAHVGAIAILLSFGVLQGGTWFFSFDAMRASTLPVPWATTAFLLALFGFGAKAGLLPLHVWLPEAHPAAPSPVSALMSGIMLKTAVYGMLRVTFDLIGEVQWWWGLIPLALGLATAIFGVVFAAVQTDMKRLLAYSSVENIGVLFTGIGLAIVFQGVGIPVLATVALLAVLYHSLNHAFMKSLLFLGTGAVLHATGERNLGRLGGLIHRMPWAGWLTLVGVLAIAGLPPLNGFVSEWLLLQVFLFSHEVPKPFVNMLLPLGAAVVALAAALAGYVMVKFFGIVFLGQPREPTLAHAHDVDFLEKIGLAWLAAGCIALGLFPNHVLSGLATATSQLTGVAPDFHARSWWMLAPLPERALSYSPIILLALMTMVIALTFLIVRAVYRRPVRRAPPWDCGYARLDPRMQDTAEGFGQPIRHIFAGFFAIERDLPAPLDAAPRYRVSVTDRIWRGIYLPIGGIVQRITDSVAWLQQGRISVYLTYSFITLVVLLAVML
jgi:formate hydrogenlyase subunit 3/multisubunit Na+/H+ antiporter MnhD subunit